MSRTDDYERRLAKALAIIYGDGTGPPLTDHEYGAAAVIAIIEAEQERPLDAHQPGDSHEYELKCKACGWLGQFTLSVEPQRFGYHTEFVKDAALAKPPTHRMDGPRLRCVVDGEKWPCAYARSLAKPLIPDEPGADDAEVLVTEMRNLVGPASNRLVNEWADRLIHDEPVA